MTSLTIFIILVLNSIILYTQRNTIWNNSRAFDGMTLFTLICIPQKKRSRS